MSSPFFQRPQSLTLAFLTLIRENAWLIVIPTALLLLAFLNFFVLNQNDYEQSVLVMPVIVGAILGGLVQTLQKQRVALRLGNQALSVANTALRHQQVETMKMLRRMQQIQSGAFIAIGAVHDIRNIITPIMLGGELISPQNDEDEQTLKDIVSSSERCLELTNRILRTLNSSDYSPVMIQVEDELPLIWKQVESLLPESIDVQLTVQPYELQVDRNDLMQILHNLALNSYHATKSTLRLEITGGKKGTMYQLELADNGPGMPAHVLRDAKSLQLLRREADEVHGLGLSIVLQLLQRNHIGLNVDSSEHGTRFCMLFSGPKSA